MLKTAGLQLAEEASAGSAASMVYWQIRRDILNASLKPYERLRIEALTERYDVGASPIREALNRLSAEALVIQKDQKGFRVAAVGEEDLRELTRARCLLNDVLLRESLALGDGEWEENLLLAFHRLSRASPVVPGDPPIRNPTWHGLHTTFHRALLAGAQSEILLAFSEVLYDRAERYRSLSRSLSAPTNRDTVSEHKAITEAALDRRVADAIELLNKHIQKTSDIVMQQLKLSSAS